MEPRGMVEGDDAASEEAYVAEAEDGSATLFVLGNPEALSGAAGIEECTDG